MADSPTTEASHDSHAEENNDQQTSKLPAIKDKECPYCHQPFTSSSLGRHLDQFLSKKKPDGIHNVDEIRKLRGGITRRTARSGKKDHDENHSASNSPALQQSAHDINRILNRASSSEDVQFNINRLNWHSTGVITDASTINTNQAAGGLAVSERQSSPEKKRSYSTYSQDINPATTTENARALELALREVLDTIRSASKHCSPQPSPFDFDINAQTFPSLCLLLLPTPPTLFQPSPFSTLSTLPIQAPGADQVQPLRQQIHRIVDSWKWNSLRLAQPTSTNIGEEADFLSRSAKHFSEIALAHLETAFQNWMLHPPDIRSALWCVELHRAHKTEKNKVEQLEEKLEQVKQEANQLEQQVEYLSKCQWPREMALWPPERTTFDKSMREELRLIDITKTSGSENDEVGENVNTRGDKWDFDKLVNKWKLHVREDRLRRMPQSNNLKESGTKTPPEMKKSKPEATTNGISSNINSPTSYDERSKPLRPARNITLISD